MHYRDCIRVAILTTTLFPAVLLADDVHLGGTISFAAIDGSAQDHDGLADGVFSVDDGNLVIGGIVQCNDDAPLAGSAGACGMRFSVSGDLVLDPGAQLLAENRRGNGSGGSVTLEVGGDLILRGASATGPGALISTESATSGAGGGGAVTLTAEGAILIESQASISSASRNALAGSIHLSAGGVVTIDGFLLAGPSRTLLATSLTGSVLAGGTGNQQGGAILIESARLGNPSLTIGSHAVIASQGSSHAGPVTLEACGIEIRGLVASLSGKNGTSHLAIRSGRNLVVDSSDLGVPGPTPGRYGRLRADGVSTTSKGTIVSGLAVEPAASGDGWRTLSLLAAEHVVVLGPSGTLFTATSTSTAPEPGADGGTIRAMSLGGTITAAGNAFSTGRTGSGGGGGSIEVGSAGDVDLDGAVLEALGDIATNNQMRRGGAIAVRSFGGSVFWREGRGDARPVGSGARGGIQGSVAITACDTIDIAGTTFPTVGAAFGGYPSMSFGVCSPSAPSLPVGELPLPVCNTPPVADSRTASLLEDESVTLSLTGSDADGDPLVFSISSGPSHGVLSAFSGATSTSVEVTYTPDADYFGSDAFTFSVDDGNGGTAEAAVDLSVGPVNDAPSFLGGADVTVDEDSGPATVSAWATTISAGPANESAQSVAFTLTGNTNSPLFAAGPAISPSGDLSFTPADDGFGTAEITVVATDDGGVDNGGVDTSSSYTFTIAVSSLNDAPVADDQDVVTDEDLAVAITLTASDVEGDSLSFTVTGGPDHGVLTGGGSSYTYSPDPDFHGSDSFTFEVSDGSATSTATVSITVEPVNDAPEADDQTVTTDEDAAVGITLAGTDVDGDSLTFSVTAGPANGALSGAAPALTYTPGPDFFGSDSFTFEVSDGSLASTAVVSITVEGVNDAPSFVKGPDVEVAEDSGSQSFPSWASAISPGPMETSQSVTFLIQGNTNSGLFASGPTVSSNGMLTFTPAFNAFGSALITLALMDDGGTANGGVNLSASQSFSISVASAPDPPQAGADSYEAIGNTTLQVAPARSVSPSVFVVGSLLTNDTPGDGPGPLTASLAGASAGAVVNVASDGSFTYLPPVGFSGTDSFTYQVSDGGSSSTASVTIEVTGNAWYVKNDAPAGGTGRSGDPFDTLAEVVAVYQSGDTIYVFAGDGTAAGQDDGITLLDSQRLIGEGVALEFDLALNGSPAPVVVHPAGGRPRIETADLFEGAVEIHNLSDVEVAGLELSGTRHGIQIGTSVNGSGSAYVHDNTLHAEQLNAARIQATGTGTLEVRFHGNSASSNSDALSTETTAGSTRLDVSGNSFTSTSGVGASIAALPGTLVVTGFSSNQIVDSHEDGLVITNATFDADPVAAGFQTVAAGSLTAGTPGNGVGWSGVIMNGVSGDLSFSSLGIEADAGGGLQVSASGPFTGVAGMRLSIAGGGIVATETAVALSNATLDVELDSVTSTSSSTSGVALTGVGGSIDIAGGSISGSVVDGFRIAGGDASVTYGGSIDAASGHAVRVMNLAGGGVTFSGTVSGTALGVALIDNGSGSVSFTGDLALSTGGNPAFTATGGGTVSATGTTNALTTAGAPALRVEDTTIGSGGLRFGSISATGGTNGIILVNTGTSGGLIITGDGSDTTVGGNGSGGTIGGMAGPDGSTRGTAIYLEDTANVVLRRIRIDGTNQNFGIRGIRVNGFALEYSTVAGTNGTSSTAGTHGEGSIYFGGLAENGLSGTSSITDSIVSGGRARNVSVANVSGASTLAIGGTTFGATQSFANSGSSLAIEARNAGTSVDATVSNSAFTGAAGDLANFTGQSGTTMDVGFTNNTLTNNHPFNAIGGGGLTIASRGVMTLDVRDNTMRDAHGSAMTLFRSSATAFTGTVASNQIGVAGVAGSGSASGNGIFYTSAGGGSASLSFTGNVIQNYAGNAGIYADAGGGTSAQSLTITGNTTVQPGSVAFAGLALVAGSPGSSDDIDICTTITGNDFSAGDPSDSNDIIVGISTATSSIRLPGYAGSSEADVQNFIRNNNLNVGSTSVTAYVDPPATAANFIGGSCP